MMANVALIFSGQFVKYASAAPVVAGAAAVAGDHWGRSLNLLMGAVVAGGGLVMSLYAYMQKYVRHTPPHTHTPHILLTLT